MDVDINPRPNFKITRSCGNCKFFAHTDNKRIPGHCVLPDGLDLLKTREGRKKLKLVVETLAPTHYYCVCDNHQWYHANRFKTVVNRTGVKIGNVK